VPSHGNPIEEAFSKIKGILGRIEARTREVLVGVLGEAILAVTARDAHDFFEHCGYRTLIQSLLRTLYRERNICSCANDTMLFITYPPT
jgi:hypothetical protein